jgi:hypothetical protein
MADYIDETPPEGMLPIYVIKFRSISHMHIYGGFHLCIV